MPPAEALISNCKLSGNRPLHQLPVSDTSTTTSSLSPPPSSGTPFLDRTTIHSAKMFHGTTRHLMYSIIEAYIVLLQRLADSVCGLLTALGCVMLQIIVVAVFPIVCLFATFYIIMTSLAGVSPLQELSESSVTAELQAHEVGTVTADNSPADIINGSSESATAVEDGGHTYILSTNPLPAIPCHLKTCEYFTNTVNLNLLEAPFLLVEGDLIQVRLGVGQRCFVCGLGYAKMVLENLIKELNVRGPDGVGCAENERGRLEMGTRVYVGPVEWLLRVLMEEA